MSLRPRGLKRRVREFAQFGWLALPVIRQLRMMQLRRVGVLNPLRDRGTPVVRHYWHDFLEQHRGDIQGHVLAIGSRAIIQRFGTGVTRTDILDVVRENPETTIVADLTACDHVASDQFDCFVNQFTMHILWEPRAAMRNSLRLVKPGGTLLINFVARSGFPTQGIDYKDAGVAEILWWFTPATVRRMFAEVGLTPDDYELRTYGSYIGMTAYLAGIPAEELTPRELAEQEPDIPLLICARVRKPLT
jgi:SAM-dependent methyltransferase